VQQKAISSLLVPLCNSNQMFEYRKTALWGLIERSEEFFVKTTNNNSNNRVVNMSVKVKHERLVVDVKCTRSRERKANHRQPDLVFYVFNERVNIV
jgi:hypothetical protein